MKLYMHPVSMTSRPVRSSWGTTNEAFYGLVDAVKAQPFHAI